MRSGGDAGHTADLMQGSDSCCSSDIGGQSFAAGTTDDDAVADHELDARRRYQVFHSLISAISRKAGCSNLILVPPMLLVERQTLFHDPVCNSLSLLGLAKRNVFNEAIIRSD